MPGASHTGQSLAGSRAFSSGEVGAGREPLWPETLLRTVASGPSSETERQAGRGCGFPGHLRLLLPPGIPGWPPLLGSLLGLAAPGGQARNQRPESPGPPALGTFPASELGVAQAAPTQRLAASKHPEPGLPAPQPQALFTAEPGLRARKIPEQGHRLWWGGAGEGRWRCGDRGVRGICAGGGACGGNLSFLGRDPSGPGPEPGLPAHILPCLGGPGIPQALREPPQPPR